MRGYQSYQDYLDQAPFKEDPDYFHKADYEHSNRHIEAWREQARDAYEAEKYIERLEKELARRTALLEAIEYRLFDLEPPV